MDHLKELTVNNWSCEAQSYGDNVRKNDLPEEKQDIWKTVINENIPQGRKLKVLDVGTGPGFFAILMAQMGHTVTAVDCSEDMLRQAKQNAENTGISGIEFVCADCENLPFSRESFDVIMSRNVTWTLLHARDTYSAWINMLRPGGRLLIFDANWNYRYHNPAYMEAYQKDCARFRELFKKEADTYSQAQEDYRRQVPMCKVKRPQWDLNTLADFSLTALMCDFNIGQRVWDEERKVKYRSTPMFLIVAEK